MDKEREAVFRQKFEAAGRKFDVGKSCVRFRKLDDLDLRAVAAVVGSTTVEEFIQLYEHSRQKRGGC